MLDIKKFVDLEKRLIELEKLIIDPKVISNINEYQKLLKEHGNINSVVKKFQEYKALLEEKKEIEELIDRNVKDTELRLLADEDLNRINSLLEKTTKELLKFLQKDEQVGKNSIIMEIRAGTGGDEAALFSADLFRMYTKYFEKKSWKIDVLDSHQTGLKGFKEIIFSVEGEGILDELKFESGIHRVQRIPLTEASGRIHTSTSTVAVLPQIEDVQLHINPQELRIDTYRASGPGGQHLQKTDSAVRITHIPTGIVAQCQDERSQIRNREKAMKLLRARLYTVIKSQQEKTISDERRKQIGSAERAEKIRTYNFPQNRITDHRTTVTLYNLDLIINGELDRLIKSIKLKLQNEQNTTLT